MFMYTKNEVFKIQKKLLIKRMLSLKNCPSKTKLTLIAMQFLMQKFLIMKKKNVSKKQRLIYIFLKSYIKTTVLVIHILKIYITIAVKNYHKNKL